MYTDGACSGNPGPGGWGAILIEDGRELELSGGENPTTNQRMELTAPLEGLRSIAGRRRVAIYSDSAYVINCFRDRWYERWRRNGWINSQKKPVDNRDLWERADRAGRRAARRHLAQGRRPQRRPAQRARRRPRAFSHPTHRALGWAPDRGQVLHSDIFIALKRYSARGNVGM